MHGRSGQQRSISHPELRPANLTAENLKLVPQHQQLNVLHVQATTTPNKRRQQRPKREVEEGEGHAADPPNPRIQEQRHQYWRPSVQFKGAQQDRDGTPFSVRDQGRRDGASMEPNGRNRWQALANGTSP